MVTTRTKPPHIREPNRTVGVITFPMSEDALPLSHPARLIWTVLGTFDLAAFSADITATSDTAGRPQLSPRMKLTLWIFALTEGISSARKIARPCVRDAP